MSKNMIRFDKLHYDSRTGNLLLTFCGKPAYTAGNLDRAGIENLLGEDLASRLFKSSTPPPPGWEYTLSRDGSFWQLADGCVVARIISEAGEASEYLVRALLEENNPLTIDVQRRGDVIGEESMSLSAGLTDDGRPMFYVHDTDGIWAGNLELRQDGKVVLTPGNYSAVTAMEIHDANEAARPSYEDILSRISGELERVGSDPYETLKMISKALVQAPPKALEHLMAFTPAD